jgi:WD40 repeat protein
MKKIFTLQIISALLFQLSPVTVQPATATQLKSFAQWCQQKNTLPASTKLTIDILLKKAGSEDCQIANTKLKSITKITLADGGELNLHVLAGLTNLNLLYIRGHKNTDLKPLSALKNLRSLELIGSSISDITPLANLTKLTYLHLGNNQISNIKPLASLTKLTYLSLENNQISDLTPLASLINLTDLSLQNNQIRDIKPLANLINLTELHLENNQISDLKSLAGLTNLKTLTTLPQTELAQTNNPPASKKLLRTLQVPSKVSLTALSRDRQTLVTAQDGSITVWNLATGTSHSHTLLDREYATISALVISPDGRTLITGSSGMDIKEAASGSGCSGLSCKWGTSSSNTKSKFGCAIQLWELSTGKGIGMLALSQEEQLSFLERGTLDFSGFDRLEFSSDGTIFFSSNKKKEILAWSYPSGKSQPAATSAYKPMKETSIVEISGNGKTSKIDIFAID